MPVLDIGPRDGLAYEYAPPDRDGHTFVFVNALTGSLDMWEAVVAPALREAGQGTLSYNFRGQAGSPFSPGTALDPDTIVQDLQRLTGQVGPPRPVLTGLSIGGLFAAQAVLAGTSARGLVLINTLRAPTARLDWINRAMVKAVSTGGTQLLMDVLLPMLVNDDQLDAMRDRCLGPQPYTAMDPADGLFNLMQHAGDADWNLAYESLDLPVLIMTGLRDRVFYDAEDVAALAARIPHPQRVDVADAGHLIPLERPEATVSALLTFATSLKGA